MEYAVQDIKVSENLVQAIASARAPKNWILRCFSKPSTISLRDYQLGLRDYDFMHAWIFALITRWNSQANSQRAVM